MLRVVLKRVGSALAVLVVVTLLTFLVLRVIPGDAATLELGLEASPEKVETLREALGTNKPLPRQYIDWIGGVLTGDWGVSSQYGDGVRNVIASTLPVTLLLAGLSMLISVVVSCVLGTLAALHQGSAFDALARLVTQAGTAIPGFLAGVVLMLVFGLGLGWFPVSGFVPMRAGVLKSLHSLVLPAIALAIGECGMFVRVVRSSVLESLQRDFMLSTRVKGLSRARSVVAYALRSSLAAPLAVIGVQMAKLVGGTAVIESVFALPGLGRLLLNAVAMRDVMLMQGIVLFITTGVVLVTLLTDLIVMAIDPNVREQTAGDAI